MLMVEMTIEIEITNLCTKYHKAITRNIKTHTLISEFKPKFHKKNLGKKKQKSREKLSKIFVKNKRNM